MLSQKFRLDKLCFGKKRSSKGYARAMPVVKDFR